MLVGDATATDRLPSSEAAYRQEEVMRLGATALVLFAATSVPALASSLDKPSRTDSPVILAADLDAPARAQPGQGRVDSYGNWRYRAAYTRWLHNEYVKAGYPIRRRGNNVPRGCCR
jgi:hypothetical protein